MADINLTPIKTFVSGENVTPDKLNRLAQSTVALTTETIVNDDVSPSAAIALAKLATGALPAAITVTTANMVDASVTPAKLSGAQTGSAPIYGCRAWVSFDGTTANNLAGTYTRTGTDVTIAATAHGLIAGNVVRLDFTAGTPSPALDGTYTVTAVDNANTFHVTTVATGTITAGTLSILRRLINGAGNVSSVTYLNTSGDYVVNFAVAMPDANYAVTHGGRPPNLIVLDLPAPTGKAFYLTSLNSVSDGTNFTPINCSVFR